MKIKVFSALVLCSIMICSCSSNEYKFFQSITATLSVYNTNTYEWKDYKVAVDVYSKKGKNGYYKYKVKNSDGVEYSVSRASMYPTKFATWDGSAPFCVNNFRQGNLIGTLYLPF